MSETTGKSTARRRPVAAREPQDRQPKAPPKAKATRLPDGGFVVIHKGVSVQIPAEAFNDWELLEDVAGDGTKMPSVLRRLVGADYDAVKETCRDPGTGRVLADGPGSITEWLTAVFEAVNPS